MKNVKLSSEQINGIIKDERAYKIIAFEYDVSESTVGYYKRRAGIVKYGTKHNNLPAQTSKLLCCN